MSCKKEGKWIMSRMYGYLKVLFFFQTKKFTLSFYTGENSLVDRKKKNKKKQSCSKKRMAEIILWVLGFISSWLLKDIIPVLVLAQRQGFCYSLKIQNNLTQACHTASNLPFLLLQHANGPVHNQTGLMYNPVYRLSIYRACWYFQSRFIQKKFHLRQLHWFYDPLKGPGCKTPVQGLTTESE